MIGMTALSRRFLAEWPCFGTLMRTEPGIFPVVRGVTLCPMLCAVISFSVIHQHLDFSFNRDRYGLMYVFFALLGWGGLLLGGSGERRFIRQKSESLKV